MSTKGKGQSRRKLAGKGPTPKAKDRVGHPANRKPKNTRTKRGPEVILGRNSVLEALKADVPATEILVAETIRDDKRVQEAQRIADKKSVEVRQATTNELDVLADGLPHQGIILRIPPYKYANLGELVDTDAQRSIVLVLDHLQDAGNIGAIARSAAAFGVAGLVIPNRRSASVTAAAWRASAGALARLPVAQVTNIARSLTDLQKAGYLVVGLTAEGGRDITKLDPTMLDRRVAIVVGNEATGLSQLAAQRCDIAATIPIAAETESLNASVATAIALYTVSQT